LTFSKHSIFLSFADLKLTLQRGWKLLVVGCLSCACLAFFYQATRPLRFTAQGIFQGNTSAQNNHIFKMLEFLGENDSYLNHEDARSFLHSYPVIAGVIKTLNLQATIQDGTDRGFFREFWYTLKTAFAYRKLKKHPPPSKILEPSLPVPSRLIVPDLTPSLVCTAVEFSAEVSFLLSIHFLDSNTFEVKAGRRLLGTGTLDQPFTWEWGMFILTSTQNNIRQHQLFRLHLLPLPQAIQSIQRSLILKRDKENRALICLKYAHEDRHLASQIVNETMAQFQNYLAHEGKKKITKQLAYLRTRQNETLEQLQEVLEQQKTYLESHLDSGMILSLEQELEFMSQTQARKKQNLIEIQAEMEYLAPISHNFSESLQQLHSGSTPSLALSVESARAMIACNQQELGALNLDRNRYDYCLQKLSEPDCDCSPFVKILNDPSLKIRFEKIHSLHHRLIDEKNWSSKEREQLRAELETEKDFLQEHIGWLKQGAELHIQTLQHRLNVLHQDLLALLADRYDQELNALEVLNAQVKHIPEKWLREQKITLTSKMHQEIMESITKMIEAKNIGYNLDYLLAHTLKPATPSVLPDRPYLLLGICVGGLIGVLLTFLALLFWAVWKGPRATYANLVAVGRHVIPSQDTIALLGLELTQKGPVVLISALHALSSVPLLINWLKKRGEKVYVIDLSGPQLPHCLEGYDLAYLTTSSFRARLESYKHTHDRILFLTVGPIQGFIHQALLFCADAVIYEVVAAEESLSDLSLLPPSTCFVVHPFHPVKPLLSFKELVPKLEKLLQRIKKPSLYEAIQPKTRGR
jgi:hypothetical protein